jgi:hypothetical protein
MGKQSVTRKSDQVCATCTYSVPLIYNSQIISHECRIRAPTMMFNGNEVESGWPEIQNTDHCGEWSS